MRHRWMLWAIVWLAAATGLPAVQAQTDLVSAAKKEGRVAVYGTLESPIFEVIQALFREKYGIPVEYFRLATNRLLDRVLTEVRAGKPQFDVVLSNLSPMLLMKKEGAFAKYVSPSYAPFPSASLDRDGILSPPYRMVVISILYNTRLVSPAEAPKTLADLLNEKWKGKVVMPDPTQHKSPRRSGWTICRASSARSIVGLWNGSRHRRCWWTRSIRRCRRSSPASTPWAWPT